MGAMIIDRFVGPYAFLSNFATVYVVIEGGRDIYPSVEHAYQAAKTLDENERRLIRDAATPGAAKRLGRRGTIRPNWDAIKISIMRDLVQQKFLQEPFKSWLLATRDAVLLEGNTWHDNFWGTCRCTACAVAPGENWLGKILMWCRAGLQ